MPWKFGVYLHLQHMSAPAGHISSAQWLHVARGYHIGQLRIWRDICSENIHRVKGVGGKYLLETSSVPATLLLHNL